jgi:four helix bundle protein
MARPHERLDAFHVAVRMAQEVVQFTRDLPPGRAVFRDQLQRSALAVVRHVAEAANRRTAADRRARFNVARGECAECDATLLSLSLIEPETVAAIASLRLLTDRVGALLTGLITCESRRLDRSDDGSGRGP